MGFTEEMCVNTKDLSSGKLEELEGVMCLRGSYLIDTLFVKQEVVILDLVLVV